jgi:hypothetical protein
MAASGPIAAHLPNCSPFIMRPAAQDYLMARTSGGIQDPSRIEGAFSFGQ